MRFHRMALLCSVGLIAGCFPHSASESVQQLPSGAARRNFVASIDIVSVPPDVSPEFSDKLLKALKTRLAKCAVGPEPLQLKVTVDRFTSQNAALTLLAGSSNVIKGTAKLIDPRTGAMVGDYDIAQSVGGGGVIAALGMTAAEATMSDNFAIEVCSQAFPKQFAK